MARTTKNGEVISDIANRSRITFGQLAVGVFFSYDNAQDKKNAYLKVSDTAVFHLNSDRIFIPRPDQRVVVYLDATIELGTTVVKDPELLDPSMFQDSPTVGTPTTSHYPDFMDQHDPWEY